MKTFREFIYECYFILIESKKENDGGRGGPDYNYEHAFANIYNHMIKIDTKKYIKGAVSRGDIPEVIDYLAREINKAQKDPKHPLHFDNVEIGGFTGVKKPEDRTEEHKEKYYEKLLDQQYSFLNFIMSKSGKKNFVNHNVARVEGATKIPTTSKYADLSGKKQDTSKVDVRFFDKDGDPQYGLSLKDAKGAVVNSSGADETKTLMMMGVGELLNKQLKDGIITPEQKNELESFVNDNANELGLFMASTKGMSKEQQKDALPKMQSYLDKLEQKIPGATEALSSEAITGKGKFGDADSVDALFSTGRGGEVIEDPRWLAQYIRQRGRLGKGQTKPKEGPREQRPTSFSGDIKKDEIKSDENRPTDSEWLRSYAEKNKPGWVKQVDSLEPETQRELRNSLESGELDIADFDALVSVDKKLKNFRQLQTDMENSKKQQAIANSETSVAQAQQAVAAAEAEKQSAQNELETNPDGTKTYRQHQAQKRINNPNLNTRLTTADQAVQTANTTFADIQARAAQSQQQKPEVQQQQRTEPVDTKPQQPTTAPSQPQQPQDTQTPPSTQAQQTQTPPPEQQQQPAPAPEQKPELKKKKPKPENTETADQAAQ